VIRIIKTAGGETYTVNGERHIPDGCRVKEIKKEGDVYRIFGVNGLRAEVRESYVSLIIYGDEESKYNSNTKDFLDNDYNTTRGVE
jgi:hypothetical protein